MTFILIYLKMINNKIIINQPVSFTAENQDTTSQNYQHKIIKSTSHHYLIQEKDKNTRLYVIVLPKHFH